MKRTDTLSGDEQELLAALRHARSRATIQAVLGWPRWRVGKVLRRLEEARLVRTVRRGRELVIQPRGSPFPSSRWVREAETLSVVLAQLAEEGWELSERRGHKAVLANAAGATAVVAAYPSGIRVGSIRVLTRRLATAPVCPDVLFVYTGKPGPLWGARWPKTGKPVVVIRALGPSRSIAPGGKRSSEGQGGDYRSARSRSDAARGSVVPSHQPDLGVGKQIQERGDSGP